jgi:quercetin dioxygenase-like cupin family protein
MYQAKFYKKIDKERIAEEVEREGFDPVCITDPPGRDYPSHHHAETKLLVFLEGTMEVTVGDRSYDCKPGDKLIIPGNAEHSAVAGPKGCTFFWSEKL